MSSEKAGYMAGVPNLCLICNKVFEESVEEHIETEGKHERWDYVRVDRQHYEETLEVVNEEAVLTAIESMINRRNVYDEHSDEELLETAKKYREEQ